MNRNDKLGLIKKHAPVLWLHEEESFVPEDCKVAVGISELYRKGRRLPGREQPRSLDDLGGVKRSRECYLKIPDLDMQAFTIPPAYAQVLPGQGPRGVGQLARLRYGRDLATGVPDDPDLPKDYARVSSTRIEPKNDTFTRG